MAYNLPQVKPLAPDTGTLERAKPLAKAAKWQDLQSNTQLVWGACRSSGVQYYKVIINLKTTKTLCTCPSRKKPCKHALALFLLTSNAQEYFHMTEDIPDWVRENLAKEKLPPDPARIALNKEAVEKNKQQRLELMKSGFTELDIWLSDTVRQGLASLENVNYDYWQDLSAKMVDAKLGGIGRRIKSFAYLTLQENWQEKLLQELAELYLLSQGFQQLEHLSKPLQEEILSIAGVNTRKQEVLTRTGVKDYWLVIGQTSGVEENLNFQRTWLLGKETQRMGLILEFVWGNGSFEFNPNLGQLYWGELVYYPSSYPLRGIFRHFERSEAPFNNFQGCINFQDLQKKYAQATAANPWLLSFPVLLEDVTPIYNEENIILVDSANHYISIKSTERSPWVLLALSGGHPICLFGEWERGVFLPLSALVHNRLIHL